MFFTLDTDNRQCILFLNFFSFSFFFCRVYGRQYLLIIEVNSRRGARLGADHGSTHIYFVFCVSYAQLM